MRISLNWIKDYVDLNGVDIKDLINKFTLSTAEIEDVIDIGSDIKGVVVGKIVKVEKHPSSEKLTIVKVDVGDEIVQSVCGAQNVKEGILIPFAKVDGAMKKVSKIEKTLVAGVESNGICCSESEIGVSEDHSGLMILSENLKIGMDIKDVLQIDDTIIEIDNKSLTHRPDLWGHYGIAREVAALVKRPLKQLTLDMLEGTDSLAKEKVLVEDTQKCFRYSCLRIQNFKRKLSPENLRLRLFYCGVRPISLAVDLTNYVMLELGQPMHSFDGKDIKEINVRSTKVESVFATLDGVERRLSADTLMICNEDREVAIAGVMGGQFSEVSDSTDSILLESANFDGSAIRKTALKLSLRTESSSRFEKVLDPELTAMSIRRYVHLLKESDPGINFSSALTDVYPKKYDTVKIDIEKSFIDRYMGKIISNEEIVEILEALEFKVSVLNGVFSVVVPSFRATKDVTIKADVLEEISRIHGYNNIEPKTCTAVLEPLIYNEDRISEHKIKEMLSENYGYSEVQSYLWYDNAKNVELGIGKRQGLKVANSNSDSNEMIRDSMVPTMLYFSDVNRKHFDEFKMFEIGSVVEGLGSDNLSNERKKLCIFAASKKKSENELFYSIKGVVNIVFDTLKNMLPLYADITDFSNLPWIHPAKAADIIIENYGKIGVLSALHPMIRQNIDKKFNMVFAEIDMPTFYSIQKASRKVSEVSRFPEISLDLSILVDKTRMYDLVYNDLKKFNNQNLADVSYVDIFEGKDLPQGKISMTFNFKFTSFEKTFSGSEIDEIKNSLFEYVKSTGYEMR